MSGINDAGVVIEAASICLLRQKFEAVVDEFLHRQACEIPKKGKRAPKKTEDGQN